MEGSVRWSKLPTELWSMIGKKLDTHMDVKRFRSVCSSWRSLIPPVPMYEVTIGTAYIAQSVVYLLEPPPPPPPSPESLQGPPSREGWLIKVAEYKDPSGRCKLFNPLSSRRIYPKDGTFPEVLCTMEYRVTEISVEYYLIGKYQLPIGGVRKVIMLPDSQWPAIEETRAVGILGEGKLKFWKHGDKDWNALDDPNCQYDDVIAYKGQFYVIDRFGIVSWINPSFKIVQFSPPVCGDGAGGDQKHLVESGGDLYVVDRYLRLCSSRLVSEATGFRVYRLNHEWGKWDETRNLGDFALFLGDHSCFSVSVNGFSGCKGNCIYFTDTNATSRGKVRVFDVVDRSVKSASCSPDHLRILWPPPAWVAPNGAALSPDSWEELMF